MTDFDRKLMQIVDQVNDGAEVDWQRLYAEAASSQQRTLIMQLGRIASIADQFRRLSARNPPSDEA